MQCNSQESSVGCVTRVCVRAVSFMSRPKQLVRIERLVVLGLRPSLHEPPLSLEGITYVHTNSYRPSKMKKSLGLLRN